jgi:hypothetical protein
MCESWISVLTKKSIPAIEMPSYKKYTSPEVYY